MSLLAVYQQRNYFMAIFDDNTQAILESIQNDLEQKYGEDTKGIPFHITLGSYAVEETERIAARITDVAN